MTSNLGSEIIADETLSKTDLVKKIWEILQNKFRPEFLNRIDQTIIFEKLTPVQLTKIVGLQLNLLAKRLVTKQIQLEFSEKLKDHLAKHGYDAVFGARPLKRVIQTEIEDELALEVIEGKIKPGNKVILDLERNRVTFVVK